MLYVRLAARFRSQRINALVDASLRLHQTSKPSKARNPDASAHSAAGSLLGGTSLLGGGGMLKLGLTRQASVDTTVGASGNDLIMRVGQLDLDLEAKEILQPLLMKSQASGTAPRWSELLAKSTVEVSRLARASCSCDSMLVNRSASSGSVANVFNRETTQSPGYLPRCVPTTSPSMLMQILAWYCRLS
eukprot:2308774-Rhodomonas_salina.3